MVYEPPQFLLRLWWPAQGEGLSRDSANAGSTGMLTPSATIILSRRGTEGETTLQPSL